jgi:hypothetical protein
MKRLLAFVFALGLMAPLMSALADEDGHDDRRRDYGDRRRDYGDHGREKDRGDGKARSDFALLDQEPTVMDVSVQCGAIRGWSDHMKAAAFTMFITMTNRSDLGGTSGFVRVTYRDGDFVDYRIPVDTTLNITLAAGGTVDRDDIITVTGTGGAVLVGQASLLTDRGRPHPDLPGQDGRSFCTTTPSP